MTEPTNPEKPVRVRSGVTAMAIMATAVQQVQELIAIYPVERVVDLGSSSPDFLLTIARQTGRPVLGTRSLELRTGEEDPRLRHIAFVDASPLEMVRKYRSPGTLFTSVSMFGHMTPTDVQMLFDGISSALTFAARGVLTGEGRAREKGGWDHNYVDLLKGWELLELQAQPRAKPPGVETIVGTAYRR